MFTFIAGLLLAFPERVPACSDRARFQYGDSLFRLDLNAERQQRRKTTSDWD